MLISLALRRLFRKHAAQELGSADPDEAKKIALMSTGSPSQPVGIRSNLRAIWPAANLAAHRGTISLLQQKSAPASTGWRRIVHRNVRVPATFGAARRRNSVPRHVTLLRHLSSSARHSAVLGANGPRWSRPSIAAALVNRAAAGRTSDRRSPAGAGGPDGPPPRGASRTMRPSRPAATTPLATSSSSACGSTLCEHEAMNRNPPGSTSGAASRASLR